MINYLHIHTFIIRIKPIHKRIIAASLDMLASRTLLTKIHELMPAVNRLIEDIIEMDLIQLRFI